MVANSKGHHAEVARHRNPCLLEYRGSFVTQAQLDDLHMCFCVTIDISMSASRKGELPQHV